MDAPSKSQNMLFFVFWDKMLSEKSKNLIFIIAFGKELGSPVDIKEL